MSIYEFQQLMIGYKKEYNNCLSNGEYPRVGMYIHYRNNNNEESDFIIEDIKYSEKYNGYCIEASCHSDYREDMFQNAGLMVSTATSSRRTFKIANIISAEISYF